MDLAKAQGLSEEALVRASEVRGALFFWAWQCTGTSGAACAFVGDQAAVRWACACCGACTCCTLGVRLLASEAAESADAICLLHRPSSLPHLLPASPHSKLDQNLFPIAYYGLRTSGGKLGRWKYLEVSWGEIKTEKKEYTLRSGAVGCLL